MPAPTQPLTDLWKGGPRIMTTALAAPAGSGCVPVGCGLSMFDPIYLGIDEFGHPVYETLVYKNLLTGGEPGSGKSTLLTAIAAHGALADDCRLVLFDAKQVELGPWRDVADEFVDNDIATAIVLLRRLQRVLDNRYTWGQGNEDRSQRARADQRRHPS